MAQEQERQLEVKLYNKDDTIHLQISPMNTFQQIVEILIEDDFLDKDLDLNSLTFVDETGQRLNLNDQTIKVRKYQNKYKVIIGIKDLEHNNSKSRASALDKSVFSNPLQGSQKKHSFGNQPISTQLDEDCILNALEASIQSNKDSLQIMHENNMLTQEIYNRFVKIATIIENNKKFSNQLKDLQKKLQNSQKKNQILQKQIQSLNKLKNSSQQKPMIDMQKVGLKKEKQALQKKIKQLAQQLKNIKFSSQNSSPRKVIQLEQDNKQLKDKVKQYQQKIQNTLIKPQIIKKLSFSKILFQQNNNKNWLLQQIQKLQEKKIVRDQLVYKFDPFNKTNFHKYIDDKPHILIVIKTTNNKIIGGYSQQAFKQGQIVSKSFLFDLKAKLAYKAKNTRKAIQYDPYFIVFGNNELMIKQNSNVLKTSKSLEKYYDILPQQAEKFLNNGRLQEATLESFEVFQFFMEN